MFGPLNWQDTWYSRHHLTAGLAARHRVTVVAEPPDAGALLRDVRLALRPARVIPDAHGVRRYDPPGWLPQVYGWTPIRRAFQRWRAGSVRHLTEPGLCYVWHPQYTEAAMALSDVPLVYHCYDKYDGYIGASERRVREEEEWLARHAAFCVAASTRLGEHLRQRGARRVLVLRHGVDSARFRPGLDVPPALASLPRPRLGVVARLNEALDVNALLHVATERPSWSLVLVGGEHFSDAARRERFEALCRLPNVHYMGSQPQADIPHWLCGLDVGLACYDMTTWGPYNQPIKLYEYLACGLAVASSDIEAARELGNLVERSGPDGWVPALERALASTSAEMTRRRLDFARVNSWPRRVGELDNALRSIPDIDSGS